MIPLWFEKMIEAFPQSSINDAIAVIGQLELYGATMVEFRQHWREHEAAKAAEASRVAEKTAREFEEVRRATEMTLLVACRKCGQPAEVSAVNISRCTWVGGPWQSVEECQNPDCRHTEFTRIHLVQYARAARLARSGRKQGAH